MFVKLRELLVFMTPSMPHSNGGGFLVRTSDPVSPVFPVQRVEVANNIHNLFVVDRSQLINQIRSNPDVPFFMNENLRLAQQFRDRLQRELDERPTTHGYFRWHFDSVNRDVENFKHVVSQKVERVRALNEYVINPSEETFTKVLEVSPLTDLIPNGQGKEFVRLISSQFGFYDANDIVSCFNYVAVIFQFYLGVNCDQISWLRQSSELISNFDSSDGGAAAAAAFKNVIAGTTLGLLNNYAMCVGLMGGFSETGVFLGQDIPLFLGFVYPFFVTTPAIIQSIGDPTRSFIFHFASRYITCLAGCHRQIMNIYAALNFNSSISYFGFIYNLINTYRMQVLDYFKSLFLSTSTSGTYFTKGGLIILVAAVCVFIAIISYFFN